MITVEANCPSCGVVRLAPGEFVVQVCVDHQWSAYSFRCPECGLREAKPADHHIVDLLTSAGARVDLCHRPDELREPAPDGVPRVSYDDLLDFHLLLQRDDWFERLEQLVAGTAREAPPQPSDRQPWSEH
jgi:hypothetical protein